MINPQKKNNYTKKNCKDKEMKEKEPFEWKKL